MDWVKARFDCSVEHAWITLREQIRSDANRWIELPKGQDRAVEINIADASVVGNRRDFAGNPGTWARVERSNQRIALTTPNREAGEPKVAKLIPALNDKGQCRLYLDDRELEFWQASKLVLESVLF